ncbi:Methyltransferase domain-containing protein [Sphingomonas laterariae]|uniref:Methyltransferase domain-containing protein n=1 Tax=Edaphosphingomonas laterariae TaxID=861865 RepID=A0A239D2L3_9SPHN|nr:methyltransferase domain-containing protein [Sphingomonas laterariae]SNS26655.1 Methyltransferase domain-containing protein [Sphingomonas laterariae]
MQQPPDLAEIFDRRVRRLRRDRAARAFADHAFLRDRMVEDIVDRLDSVKRQFTRALDLGTADGALAAALRQRGIPVVAADAGFAFARAAGGIQCDEDRLPFADGSFDLIVSAGALDTVNDLPGALALIRLALRPDGLFLGAFFGAGSLPRLRSVLMAADEAAGRGVAARIHPQIDVRAAGDLLARAGFALPVADIDHAQIRYGDPLRLISDLRGMGATNILRQRAAAPLTRAHLPHLFDAFAALADADGRVTETVEIVHLTAWSPGPDQPQPARRGSGQASLADALKPVPLKGPSQP